MGCASSTPGAPAVQPPPSTSTTSTTTTSHAPNILITRESTYPRHVHVRCVNDESDKLELGAVVHYPRADPAPAVVKDDKLKEDADKQFFQATFHWHHGELEEAHKLCTKAIDVFPKHKRAFLLRCEVALKLKRWDEAIEDAGAAIAMGHREGHRMRGAVHLERGRFRDAVADLNVAVRIEPSDRRAWSLRSRAHQGLGNSARAKEDAAEAERKDPDSEAGLCIVCIDEPRATRLNPCEHSALCAECARECQDHHGVCPICNTAIKAIEYGTFLGTFAPSDTANFDNLASAIKKAREELATLNGRDVTAAMGTLNPIGEGSPLSSTPNGGIVPSAAAAAGGDIAGSGEGAGGQGEVFPATPPPDRDYSGYTVGGDMNDLDGERSMPSTPAVLAGAFGDVGGVDGMGMGGLMTPAGGGGRPGQGQDGNDNTPAGWSNMATVASPRSAGSERDRLELRPERASEPVMPSMPELRPMGEERTEEGEEGGARAGMAGMDGAAGVGAPGTPPVVDDPRPPRASSPPALGGDDDAGTGGESEEAAAEAEVSTSAAAAGGGEDEAAAETATTETAEGGAAGLLAEGAEGAEVLPPESTPPKEEEGAATGGAEPAPAAEDAGSQQ